MTTKQWFNAFKWAAALAIVVLLFIFFRGCGKGSSGKVTADTIRIKQDTFWREQKKDTQYIPKIISVSYPKPVYIIDSFPVPEFMKVDTAAILKDYYATRHYSDTQQVSNGHIIIADDVSRNMITKRKLTTDFSIPEITKTVTITQPKKNVGYIGIEAFGNKNTLFYGTGASLGMKFKNDRYFEIKAAIINGGKPVYGVGGKLPLKFSKR